MKLNLARAMTIARREYLTTVRRRAFLLTLILVPLGYSVLMTFMIRSQVDEATKSLGQFKALGVVDSSGLFAAAPREIQVEKALPNLPGRAAQPAGGNRIEVRDYPDLKSALAGLSGGQVQQVLLVPANFQSDGRASRYVIGSNIFGESNETRQITRWMSRSLVAGRLDSLLTERALRPDRNLEAYSLGPDGKTERRDDKREILEFLLPFLMALLLGVAIISGGQYLLQGVSEEKESRILESMLTTVKPYELIIGKLIGLGGAGLTMVLVWAGAGASVSAPMLATAGLSVNPGLVGLMVLYFLLGYLFYGSIMTAVGSVTSNLREAQQFSIIFTMMNFLPFYAMPALMSKTPSPLAIFLSLFPPTAPTSMMLRLASGVQQVPAWQVGLSLVLLVGTAMFTLTAASRIFRTGLLLYGKTPNLPEILRWVREA